MRICPKCQRETNLMRCPDCGTVTLSEQEAYRRANEQYEVGHYAAAHDYYRLAHKLGRRGGDSERSDS